MSRRSPDLVLLFILALTFLCGVLASVPVWAQAQGGPPYGFSSGTTQNMMRPGVPGRCREAAANTTQRPVQNEGNLVAGGSSDGLACFAWGTQLRVHCTEDTKVAFTQSSTVTFGSGTDPWLLTDAEGGASTSTIGPGSGPAEMASLVDGGTWLHMVVGADPWRRNSTVTYRAYQCDDGNSDTQGHPCNGDDDCGSGGSCDVAIRPSCVFMMLEALSTGGTCYVCEER